MLLGILCTMINGFGRKGYYNSQEIGLARRLCKMGHRVIIYKGVKEGQETVRLNGGAIIIHYLEMPHIGANGYCLSGIINSHLDGLLCFSDQQLFLPHIYRYCKRNNIVFVPYIGTAHSLYTGSLKGSITNTLFSLGTLRTYKKLPVIAKTPDAEKELQDLGVKNTQVAPVGLDMSIMHEGYEKEDKEELREKYGFSPESILICNISRMQPEKRVLELIDMFDYIKDAEFYQMVLVGEGDLEDEVDQKIKDLNLQDRIKRIPKIPYDQIWEIYVMSDFFVNMNKGEIFGMACMESVYYKTSVLAIDAIGPRITLDGMKCHHVCETDKEIEYWLRAPGPPADFLEDDFQKAKNMYDWHICADLFVEIVRGKNEKG